MTDDVEIPSNGNRRRSLTTTSTDSSDSSCTLDSVTIDNDPDRFYCIDLTGAVDQWDETTARPADIIDLTNDAEINDGDYLTDGSFQRLLERWTLEAEPEIPVPPQRHATHELCNDGIIYREGQSVELQDGTFLRITTTLEEDASGAKYLLGRRLIRSTAHKGTYIPKRQDELVWIANEMADVALDDVKRFVRIHFTNNCHMDQDCQKAPGALLCRLKEIPEDENDVSVEYLSFDEADEEYRIDPATLRQAWRGHTEPFGSAHSPTPATTPPPRDPVPRNPVIVIDLSPVVIDLDAEDPKPEARKNRQYTFGDGFCGAGGVSCGARQAGLQVKWAFDISRPAITTYGLNFETAECEQSDVFSFLTNGYEFLKVDVSHGSPPCQTFSAAHTIECETDDANSACIFSCADLIRRCRPRVHTMEETSGLFERHRDTFYRIIQDFVEVGYSVHWKVLNCMDYGVPQSRRRLIILASGPGETLPQIPGPTHGLPGSGLHPYTTINQVIEAIPAGASDHDVIKAEARMMRWGPRAQYDANQQARTITTGGGDNNYHPSGRRGFTNREFACLQTFPLEYRFGRHEVRKQIGNAVPPMLAKALFGAVVESLRRTDEGESS
ncbi:DNA cytosine methyltransferase [Aspergillus candidus]|uniref:DNA (cytosine-5-)-methyltransferase n=1 Tax=Aspergillus candidus TaxID=41067 RepID=A0A2I2FKE4_ASPCN|nr:S-adenosyl-L-methionine-dependent methyltransferase [Aspergillus candidus]PLB41090.1 S-adenosyl-L-methionine-dependent methyltransferase [Aspergillus candidus]